MSMLHGPTGGTAGPCPICRRGEPLDVLVGLPSSWVTAAPDAALPGYVCVVSKTHVEEPFELDGEARAAWWDDVSTVASAVGRATGAMKLNYEIHGNTIPHLHLHLYPRYRGDPFEGAPIDPRRRPAFRRSSGQLARLRVAILASAESDRP
jgi:diadenosine tetraphosphate (Ap4A) HIT family hydrolase